MSAAGRWHFAVGAGKQEGQPGAGLDTRFAFSAHDGPNGASGYAVIDVRSIPLPFEPFEAQGPVTCLRVSADGKVATIHIAIEKGSGAATPGDTLVFTVDDLGNGNSGERDLFRVIERPLSFIPPCDDFGLRLGAYPMNAGNITVN
ncbi:MAG: hypothetical protein HYS05_08400 [Acidobacteria bacterium]|nr:hypothetical protein [Acidobacteriota bacterium]